MGSYHHGKLRRRLLELAGEIAADQGAEAVTLRELARKADVSHSAPVHHFGSRKRLLTALAAEGFASLNVVLEAHAEDIYDMGVAYVLWALEHPGRYAVMWQPQNLIDADEQLNEARDHAWALLSQAVAARASEHSAHETTELEPSDDASARSDQQINAYAAFSVVHGLAGLWLSGALPKPENAAGIAAEVTRRLVFTSS